MRSRTVVLGAGVMMLIAGSAVAGPEPRIRPVRTLQDAAELGLTAGVAPADDGALVVTAHAAGLTVEKRVYSDGQFSVQIALGKSDSVVIVGKPEGLSVGTDRETATRLRPTEDSDFEVQARRVRGWLAASAAIERFRLLADALDRQDARSPEALSLRTTGALVSELLGDPGAARRFGRSFAVRRAGYRLAQTQQTSCYDTYQRLVMVAAYQLESCVKSFAPYNPMQAVCGAIWTLQVESAWFQFLSCSAIPLK